MHRAESRFWTIAGFIPQPTLSDATQRDIHIIGELGLGVGDALEEIGLHAARAVVLNVLTFGGYGTYEAGRALWAGYQEDGFLGAVNKVNPFYQVPKAGEGATRAAMHGDYRAAGANGTTAAVLFVATVLGVSQGAAALTEAAAARAAAGGAARGVGGSFVGPKVFTNRHGQLTNGRYIYRTDSGFIHGAPGSPQ